MTSGITNNSDPNSWGEDFQDIFQRIQQKEWAYFKTLAETVCHNPAMQARLKPTPHANGNSFLAQLIVEGCPIEIVTPLVKLFPNLRLECFSAALRQSPALAMCFVNSWCVHNAAREFPLGASEYQIICRWAPELIPGVKIEEDSSGEERHSLLSLQEAQARLRLNALGAYAKCNFDLSSYQLLHRAVRAPDPAILDYLLNKKMGRFDEYDAFGLAPIHLAAKLNQVDHFNRLLSEDRGQLSLPTNDVFRKTPLFVAIDGNSVKMMEAFPVEEITSATLVCTNFHEEVRTRLWEQVFQEQIEDPRHASQKVFIRFTPVLYAARSKRFSCLIALLIRGASRAACPVERRCPSFGPSSDSYFFWNEITYEESLDILNKHSTTIERHRSVFEQIVAEHDAAHSEPVPFIYALKAALDLPTVITRELPDACLDVLLGVWAKKGILDARMLDLPLREFLVLYNRKTKYVPSGLLETKLRTCSVDSISLCSPTGFNFVDAKSLQILFSCFPELARLPIRLEEVVSLTEEQFARRGTTAHSFIEGPNEEETALPPMRIVQTLSPLHAAAKFCNWDLLLYLLKTQRGAATQLFQIEYSLPQGLTQEEYFFYKYLPESLPEAFVKEVQKLYRMPARAEERATLTQRLRNSIEHYGPSSVQTATIILEQTHPFLLIILESQVVEALPRQLRLHIHAFYPPEEREAFAERTIIRALSASEEPVLTEEELDIVYRDDRYMRPLSRASGRSDSRPVTPSSDGRTSASTSCSSTLRSIRNNSPGLVAHFTTEDPTVLKDSETRRQLAKCLYLKELAKIIGEGTPADLIEIAGHITQPSEATKLVIHLFDNLPQERYRALLDEVKLTPSSPPLLVLLASDLKPDFSLDSFPDPTLREVARFFPSVLSPKEIKHRMGKLSLLGFLKMVPGLRPKLFMRFQEGFLEQRGADIQREVGRLIAKQRELEGTVAQVEEHEKLLGDKELTRVLVQFRRLDDRFQKFKEWALPLQEANSLHFYAERLTTVQQKLPSPPQEGPDLYTELMPSFGLHAAEHYDKLLNSAKVIDCRDAGLHTWEDLELIGAMPLPEDPNAFGKWAAEEREKQLRLSPRLNEEEQTRLTRFFDRLASDRPFSPEELKAFRLEDKERSLMILRSFLREHASLAPLLKGASLKAWAREAAYLDRSYLFFHMAPTLIGSKLS